MFVSLLQSLHLQQLPCHVAFQSYAHQPISSHLEPRKINPIHLVLPSFSIMFLTMTNPLLLLLLLLAPAVTHGQQAVARETNAAPLTNEGLREALGMWFGTDHNKAEVTNLVGHISEWDTSEVTSFNSLFKGRTTLDEDLSRWNTSMVVDMADMFNGCLNMRGKPSLEGWNTSKVKTMARMFKSATSWEGDLSTFDTSEVADMSHMFQVRN